MTHQTTVLFLKPTPTRTGCFSSTHRFRLRVFGLIMSCCGGGDQPAGASQVAQPARTMPYKFLFKYIIVGDTGMCLVFHVPLPEQNLRRVALLLDSLWAYFCDQLQPLASPVCFCNSPTKDSKLNMI
jgi:hypothetical protein